MSRQLVFGVFLGFVLTFLMLLTLAFKPTTCEEVIHRPVIILPELIPLVP